MSVKSQGARPNYQSSISPLTYKKKSYTTAKHEQFVGAAVADLSEVTEREYYFPDMVHYKQLVSRTDSPGLSLV